MHIEMRELKKSSKRSKKVGRVDSNGKLGCLNDTHGTVRSVAVKDRHRDRKKGDGW